MSDQVQQEGKLQSLIEKFGGWAMAALITLASVMYQGDKENFQSNIAQLEKNIAAQGRAIGRLQEGKVSKEELKSVQEQWIRETTGLRQDIRDFMKMTQQGK